MGWYRDRLFPWALDRVMRQRAFAMLRPRVLEGVAGEILEIGFGTGLNLAHYPPSVSRLTALDPHVGLRRKAEHRIRESGRAVAFHTLRGEELPFAEATFDAVVCSWTLCSIRGVEQALREVHRVLRPGGRFHFIEHGLSPDPVIGRWQRRLTPLQRIIADGCHLDRDIRGLIEAQPFERVETEAFDARGLPRLAAHMTLGVAHKGEVFP